MSTEQNNPRLHPEYFPETFKDNQKCTVEVIILGMRLFDSPDAALKCLADIKIRTILGDWIVHNVRLKQDRSGNFFVKEPKLGFKDPIVKQLIFITPVSIPTGVMGVVSDSVKSEYFKRKGEGDSRA